MKLKQSCPKHLKKFLTVAKNLMTSYHVQTNYQNNQKHFIKQPKKLIRGAAQSNNKVSPDTMTHFIFVTFCSNIEKKREF